MSAPHVDRLLGEQFPMQIGQLQHVERIPEREAETEPAEFVLPGQIANRLGHDLYTHQSKAIDELQQGNNVCVATSTSSGKTMVYALEIARRYLNDKSTRALLTYPTKALSRDQKQSLEELYDRLGVNIDVGVYDGDTEQGEKQRVRKNSNVIITNFAGLNAYLPHHTKWSRFFSNLDMLVVDEAHMYTGIFGMHVAWIIRRLRRVANHHGSEPQFVCTSATIGNPQDHIRSLTGKQAIVIDDDGSPRGEREIAFWNPPMDDDGRQRPASIAARDVVAHLAAEDVRTLAFGRSRKMTELTAHRAEERAEDDEGPWQTEVNIEPYHAGHGKETRRKTEDGLQNGDVDAIVSTSALELGIDIGSVDAVSVIGYPGTQQSFWQQIGRAGRGGSRSIGVFVADRSSVDQYLMSNPTHLLNKEVEDAVVNLTNNQVYAKHVLAAANELTIKKSDIGILGDEDRLRETLEMFRRGDLIDGTLESGAVFSGGGRPNDDINLYATTDEQFEVELANHVDREGIDIDSIQKERAYRDYHEGATFLHQGERFVVEKMVDQPSFKQIRVAPKPDIGYYTKSRSETNVGSIEVEETREVNGFKLHRGTGSVTVHYQFFDKLDIDTNERLEQMIPTGLPPIEMTTQMCWIEVPPEVEKVVSERYMEYESKGMEGSPFAGYMGGLHAAEHAMIGVAPLELMMESGDLGGLSVIGHPAVKSSGIFIYDGVHGGLGFSDTIFERFETVAKRARKMIQNCSCSRPRGCPACVMDQNCGDGNRPLHKGAATDILDAIIGEISIEEEDTRDSMRRPVERYSFS